MVKSIFTFGFIFVAISVFPARAEMMECSMPNMLKIQTGMEKMLNVSKKEMAFKEMSFAKESMDNKNNTDCMMHMQKAKEMMIN